MADALFRVSVFHKASDLVSLNVAFVDLARDFLHAARHVGKVIIAEVFVPPAHKTIKPVDLGGTIGGDKFLVHNILFKFAVAKPGVYDDEAAAKVRLLSHPLPHALTA